MPVTIYPHPGSVSSWLSAPLSLAPFAAAPSRELGQFVGGPWGGNPTSATETRKGAFKRVTVSFINRGQSLVYWEMENTFRDPLPYSFQLQASRTTTPRADDWFDVGSPSINAFCLDTAPAAGYSSMRNYGQKPSLQYRVKLVTPLYTYLSQPALPLGDFSKYDWVMAGEILRQEQLHHRLFSSIKCLLYKERRYGPPCPECLDELTGTVTNSDCPICFGTKIVSGYYAPTEYYGLFDPVTSRAMTGQETNRASIHEVTGSGRFLGTIPLSYRDVLVSVGGDARFYVHTVKELSCWKGIPLVIQAEVRQAPVTDIIYALPLPEPLVSRPDGYRTRY